MRRRPGKLFFGVMGLFLGPLGKLFVESWLPDFQTPPPKKLSDPNLTPLPTHPGIKYVARALAAMLPSRLEKKSSCYGQP